MIETIRILGIDPGLANTGYGVIDVQGDQVAIVDCGVFLTKKELPLSKRLGEIYKDLSAIIEEYSPKCLAVEDIFFCKNVSSALSVGQAKGVIMVAGENFGLDVFEYTPLQIKQAVVGYGRATKSQVGQMVCTILGMKELPKPDHAADALAVSLCCSQDMRRK